MKDADDDSIEILRKGTQWVQVDLGAPAEIYAIVFWHAHNAPKVYHDVIVQVSDDPEFKANVKTLFNNDQDNSSGQGVGTDREVLRNERGQARGCQWSEGPLRPALLQRQHRKRAQRVH